jgi:hypothetical protein
MEKKNISVPEKSKTNGSSMYKNDSSIREPNPTANADDEDYDSDREFFVSIAIVNIRLRKRRQNRQSIITSTRRMAALVQCQMNRSTWKTKPRTFY